MSTSEGANYAPAPMPKPVVEPGEFVFAAMHLDHGHIGGMTQGLIDAGGTCKWVYDPQPERAAAFQEKFPQVQIASSEEQRSEERRVGQEDEGRGSPHQHDKERRSEVDIRRA